jgi:thiamine-phosphate pyrophosphorylase
MRPRDEKKLHRIIDANLNRAREGLRVCEDICRFIWDKKEETRAFKEIRHRLTGIVMSLDIPKLLGSRDIEGDVGKITLNGELRRREVSDIFYANAQRVKESIRVLEEFSKLTNAPLTKDLKKLRYCIYALEKKVAVAG